MKKLFITKTDTEENITAAIEESRDNEFVLVFPGGAHAATAEALSSVRERVSSLGKSFSIETVDEKLISLAGTLSIDAHHPFLHVEGRSLSDIIPPGSKRKTPPTSKSSKAKKRAHPKDTIEENIEEEGVRIPVQSVAPWPTHPPQRQSPHRHFLKSVAKVLLFRVRSPSRMMTQRMSAR